MKRILFLFTVLFVFTVYGYAQKEGKDIVYVENFSYTNRIGSSYVEALRNKVIEGLVKTDRIIVKDVNSEAGVADQLKKQTEDASGVDENTLVIMKNLHANYLIQGHVTTLEGIRVVDKEGKVSYKGSVVFSLKIVDIATGTVKGTENYSYEGSGSGLFATGTGDTPDKAISNTMNPIERDLKKMVNEYFPLEGTILEISAEKKGKATEVYIDLGEKHGIQKKQKLAVFVEREIAGRKSQKRIGEIEVEAVEGDDISLCKVKKGGEEIKTAVGEEQPIVLRTINSTGLFD